MSVAKLFSPGRQFDANVFVNSLTLSPMTTAERDALDATEGLMVYDTTINRLMLYATGMWNSVDLTPLTSRQCCIWSMAANVGVNSGTTSNPCAPTNAVVRASRGGLTPSTAGVVTIAIQGMYRVDCSIQVQPVARLVAGGLELSIQNANQTTVYARSVQTGYQTPNTVSLTSWTMNISALIELGAGSTVAFYLTNNATGGVVNINTTGGGVNPLISWFSIEAVTQEYF